MFSGVRAVVVVCAAVLLVGLTSAEPAFASEVGSATTDRTTPGSGFSENAPSPAAPVPLTMDPTETVALAAGPSPSPDLEEVSILPVPLPPAILCLLTAFAGIALLGRRRTDHS